MFSIFKTKSKVPVNYTNFFQQDMHSHILPGIDDGSPDVSTSIALIKGMQHAGIKQFFGTPHIMAELHKNNKDTISNAYQQLKAALDKNNMNIELRYAAEYMLDEGFLGHLKAGNMMTIHDNFILIETPFYQEPLDINELIFEIETHGYNIILAHPERYHYVDDNLKVFQKYLDKGMKLQLNMLSLSGYYGVREKEVARKLLERGYYSYVGTDLHHERHLGRLASTNLDKKVIKMLENNAWDNHLITAKPLER